MFFHNFDRKVLKNVANISLRAGFEHKIRNPVNNKQKCLYKFSGNINFNQTTPAYNKKKWYCVAFHWLNYLIDWLLRWKSQWTQFLIVCNITSSCSFSLSLNLPNMNSRSFFIIKYTFVYHIYSFDFCICVMQRLSLFIESVARTFLMAYPNPQNTSLLWLFYP